MLYIDDTFYAETALQQQFAHFAGIAQLQQPGGHIAYCLPDTFVGLALCLYAREQQLSVLPVHASTPKDLAERYAQKAGCEQLFYGDLNNPISLEAPPGTTAAGLIQLSSGTTGASKCIKRSWSDIAVEINSYCQHFPEAQQMTPLVACPVTHSYGLICGVLVALQRGLVPRIITNINPKFLLKQLLASDKPLLYTSPAMLSALLPFWPKGSKLHAAMISGSLMSAPAFAQVRPQVRHLFQQYGCSEVGCISLNRDTQSATAIGTVLPHLQVSAGASGSAAEEICVSQADTAAVVRTQDLGYFSCTTQGEPLLHFVARQDDTIIVAGMNVYPQDVEDVVLAHPQVSDAVLFKVPDAQAGHRACLQFCSDSALSADALHRWCCQQLADWQVPHRLEAVAQIPRLANGKINRKQLAASWLALQANQTA
ncbi:MAG: AMP-binding protein [Gammaproteobacteria bacterium]|nr:AMP-binding protein [Gammaproteobacteria bacterium]MBU1554301.1 AMP-binding protein [Gammaproteobacteria bacterium]MBU2070465.1 AMP-binding protein [Gammaproteobacteria bacterium]MBU2185266.1 AMP-binding protein [Gammaproteobacteria bacterium]MBU2205057.1 AMP-binding protein [Gammaproteobacteria bacterium]